MNLVEVWLQEVRYSLRTLRRNPGVTAVAAAMLAVGIGINAAVFTVINAALFDGYPLVHRNDRIVRITTTRDSIYYPDFEDWRSEAASFEGMALVRGVFHTLNDEGGAPETFFTTEVTGNTFRLLGVRPMLGRDFARSDERPGAGRVVILRYDMWVRRFAADPAIVGQTVRIDGLPTSVIGVMPQGFSFPASQDLWTPLVPTPAALRRETGYARYAFARLADGVTVENARAEMDTIGRRLATAYPHTNEGVAPVVKAFDEWFLSPGARTLYKAMWGAVGFVLLIICANVANLLVEQAMGRSREIAIRLALGAGRWRIVRQFLVESLLLSILGGAAGWWLARAGLRIYASARVGNDVVSSVAMDHRVLAYLTAISTASGLLAGLASATHLTRLSASSTAKDQGRGIAGGKRAARLSRLLVATEVVLAVALLASAGVIVRSFLNVSAANLGVDTANVLTMSLYIPPDRYPSPDARVSFYRELGTRLRALPGVESLGLATAAPTDYTPRVAYELAESPWVEGQSRPSIAESVVTTGYFRTLRARLISGREFDDSDRASTMPVAIVNRQFASRVWPGGAPLGKRLRLFRLPANAPTPWLTVVGVVSDIVQNDRTRQTFDPLVYVPYAQQPAPNMFAFARTSVPPASLAAAARRQIYAMDPDLPVPALMPLTERLNRAMAFERDVTVLCLFFALVALALASVGLYAAVSHSVRRRVQEIGIRMAIGATGRDILALVFMQGALPVGTGLSVGLAVSFAINRVLKAQLVGVSPADPVTLAAASAVLVLSAALGCWIPARHAMRVDPATALKHE